MDFKKPSITEEEFKNHFINKSLTLDIIKEWVEGGGDINIKDKEGKTALDLAKNQYKITNK